MNDLRARFCSRIAHALDTQVTSSLEQSTAVQEKVVFADDMLVRNAVAKIDDGDIILTYGYSSVVFSIFMQAQKV